jgi:hypothetical protein
MKINITESTTIHDLQEAFRFSYPYLTIKFFDKTHSWGEGSAGAHCYDPVFKIKSIEKKKLVPDYFELFPWSKVGEVERNFQDQLGLYAQVCRKNGERWIETGGTDELTLDEQNELGKRTLINTHDNLWIERELLY